MKTTQQNEVEITTTNRETAGEKTAVCATWQLTGYVCTFLELDSPVSTSFPEKQVK